MTTETLELREVIQTVIGSEPKVHLDEFMEYWEDKKLSVSKDFLTREEIVNEIKRMWRSWMINVFMVRHNDIAL